MALERSYSSATPVRRQGKRHDLVFWYSATSPYMADRFAALQESGRVDFECWFNRYRNSGRSWEVKRERLAFPHRFIRGVGGPQKSVGLPLRAFIDSRPKAIVTFHADLSVAPSVLASYLPQTKLIYYVEKTFDTWSNRRPAKEVMKRFLFSRADAFMTPGSDADGYLHSYGVPQSKILRLPHVIDVRHFNSAVAKRSSESSRKRRTELGLDGFVFLYVGQISKRKGIHTLIEAFERLPAGSPPVSLLLVGDGEEREFFEASIRERNLTRVRILDFVQQDELPDIYALGDAFVFPSRGDPYGLVVDEAMGSGLPVIASTNIGEIGARIQHGENGFLVPLDDADALSASMAALAQEDKAEAMGKRSMELMHGRDLGFWVQHVKDAADQLLN